MPTASIRKPNMSAAIRIAVSAKSIGQLATIEDNRRAVAELCRNLGPQDESAPVPAEAKLSPRVRQTLQRLLAGDSEKQIASNLQLSPHTVHVYVKALYKTFQVSSRGELLARFVHPSTR